MMTTALLALMGLAIAVLVVLVIYLADRFSGLERETQAMKLALQQAQAPKAPPGPYAGLSGKALWEAMTGEAAQPLDEATLNSVRKRYRLLLAEHIAFVFNEGVSDQKKGFDAVPQPTRIVRTPKMQVESWLPPEAVEELYRCGQAVGRGDPAELPGLRQRLDQASGTLHGLCGLDVLQPASSLLMPEPAPAAPAAEQVPTP